MIRSVFSHSKKIKQKNEHFLIPKKSSSSNRKSVELILKSVTLWPATIIAMIDVTDVINQRSRDSVRTLLLTLRSFINSFFNFRTVKN